ncbi:GFA family protein [Aliikangiella coralliicola]|uniref:GFA family protein n=1 Tax=Aliikangiella coralliicola TaxID=2592383 RepID=A0A545UFP0_9GAMM|nr:GFA family protein [Aliikangiella coralliicola]TQV88265.1 GFA family protein [Aliikangiella coralliicola]
MYKGSCLCGKVSYELHSEPKAVSHCHCNMCQKQHGAAFATYASLPKSDLSYISGSEVLASYNSSESVVRKFCSNCGSSIEWSSSKKFPSWVSIAIATLDTPYNPSKIKNIYQASSVCWLVNS